MLNWTRVERELEFNLVASLSAGGIDTLVVARSRLKMRHAERETGALPISPLIGSTVKANGNLKYEVGITILFSR
jgi:hypothetical protein